MAEIEFDGHPKQSVLPTTDEYVFVGHAVHVLPFAPKYPILQRQLFKLVLPENETEFAGQAVHAALPVMFLYVLEAHAVHEAPV